MKALVAPALPQDRVSARLPAWGLFAALIAMAGLPIYIHAPKVYVDDYGVSLAALGAVLFGLRLVDVAQDPLLGWLAGRTRAKRGAMVAGAAGLMALAMLGLFAVTPPVAPLLWFALTLAALFTGFSFLTIAFYAQGVAKAATFGPSGHLRLAGWREAGGLIGLSVAAVAPVVMGLMMARPYAGLALGFAVLALAAVWAMRGQWSGHGDAPPDNWGAVLRDGIACRLLLLALVNATPVAITSTLFLFFVESRLNAPGWEGPLLLLFFLAAAASAPLWSRAAQGYGTKRALLTAMGLAIGSFVFAYTLGAGDVAAFAVICLLSGAALGADLTLLPAAFARRMGQIAPQATTGFGLWSFVSKFTLAFAAIILFPVLDASGFQSGAENSATALATLSVLYALVPCGLKLLAMGLLAATPFMEEYP